MKKQKKITKETNIFEAIEINPHAAEILMNAGLGCLGCAFANAETLEQGLMAHGFTKKEIDETIRRLNK